jgi:hypothetical protein
MRLENIRNLEKVKIYRQDICKALGVQFTEDMITDDLFPAGLVFGQEGNYLDFQGLINRGFCPICGYEPIDTTPYHYRKLLGSKVKQNLCEECYKRTSPDVMLPDYRRYYTLRIVLWLIGISLLVGVFLLIRGCVKFFA